MLELLQSDEVCIRLNVRCSSRMFPENNARQEAGGPYFINGARSFPAYLKGEYAIRFCGRAGNAPRINSGLVLACLSRAGTGFFPFSPSARLPAAVVEAAAGVCTGAAGAAAGTSGCAAPPNQRL